MLRFALKTLLRDLAISEGPTPWGTSLEAVEQQG